MHILYLIGRIAFVAVFLASGVFKLMDIAGTANLIESRFTVPTVLEPYAANISNLTGLTTFQLLAIVLSVIEVVFALFIVFNVAIRSSAFILAVMMVVGTFYVHDFWNMVGDERTLHLDALIKNISILGGLLMMMAIGPWRPVLDVGDDYAFSR